jgi:hypothetical protein
MARGPVIYRAFVIIGPIDFYSSWSFLMIVLCSSV